MSKGSTGSQSGGILPRMLDSRYRLDAKLGSGGMGVVYRGMNVAIERPVAIKLLRPEYSSSEDVAERFLREARSAVKIGGQHVVEILDFGKAEDGSPFFVMELLDGVPLSTVLARERRLSVKRAVDIASQICIGLYAAHEQAIVHRDLKPANIVLVRRGDTPDFVKILDFGVAKALGEAEADLTRTGVLVGTVDYMAPEQVKGVPVDGRTDIYALGVLCYRMLTGTKPFVGEGMPAMIYHHINTEPEPLRDRAPDAGIPEALDQAVRRCMAKEPGDRFQSMDRVHDALIEVARESGVLEPRLARSASEYAFRNAAPDASARDADRLSASPSSPIREGQRASLAPRLPGVGPASADEQAHLAPTVTAPTPWPVSGGVAEDADDSAFRRFRSRRGTMMVLGALGVGALVLVAGLLFVGGSWGEEQAFEESFETASVAEDGLVLASVDSSMGEAMEPKEDSDSDTVDEAHGEAPPLPGPIVVRANATGARVIVDGNLIGGVPATIEPSSFEPVTIRVLARGYVPFESDVRPTKEEMVVQARLQRRSRPASTQRPPSQTVKTRKPTEPMAEPEAQEPKDAEGKISGEDFFPMDL